MHPPKLRDSRNPRSREDRPWKYIERIPIDESRFPTNVKPAAIIIGVRGTNHARLQDESGCCVQLRGKGISSPGTPGSEEPMHLWIKYDVPEQLQKVRTVLEEIIRSCATAAKTAQRPANIVPVTTAPRWPDALPPKPNVAPIKPIDCFYTIHYFVHSVPNVTTRNFSTAYAQFYGWPLEAKFAELGKGSMTHSLLVIPKVVRLEHAVNGTIPHAPQDIQSDAVYYVRPVLPRGLPSAVFQQHISQPTVRPTPSPPQLIRAPQVVKMMPAAAAATAAPVVAHNSDNILPELFGHPAADVQQSPLPPPEILLIQAIHGVLIQHFLRSVSNIVLSDQSILPDLADRWGGLPISFLVEHFQQQMGLNILAAKFGGHKDFVSMLYKLACPEILNMAWQEDKNIYVRFGKAGLDPDW